MRSGRGGGKKSGGGRGNRFHIIRKVWGTYFRTVGDEKEGRLCIHRRFGLGNEEAKEGKKKRRGRASVLLQDGRCWGRSEKKGEGGFHHFSLLGSSTFSIAQGKKGKTEKEGGGASRSVQIFTDKRGGENRGIARGGTDHRRKGRLGDYSLFMQNASFLLRKQKSRRGMAHFFPRGGTGIRSLPTGASRGEKRRGRSRTYWPWLKSLGLIFCSEEGEDSRRGKEKGPSVWERPPFSNCGRKTRKKRRKRWICAPIIVPRKRYPIIIAAKCGGKEEGGLSHPTWGTTPSRVREGVREKKGRREINLNFSQWDFSPSRTGKKQEEGPIAFISQAAKMTWVS